MSNNTIPVFIIGTGRCGTRMLYKLFNGVSHLETHHQYLYHYTQIIGFKYYCRLIDAKNAKASLKKIYGSAIYYSQAKYWIDSSNKASWVIELLQQLFPQANFVHLFRDGCKVTSSFLHKLPEIIYPDRATAITQQWLDSPRKYPEPPPEEKYWWNIPQPRQPFYKEFKSFNQFQRICYHWTNTINTIQKSFKNIPNKQKLSLSLEKLTSNKSVFKRLLKFLEIDYQPALFDYLKTPQNVIFPMDFDLTQEQLSQFNTIAAKTMTKLGYKTKNSYHVKY